MEIGKIYVFYKNNNLDVGIGKCIDIYNDQYLFEDEQGNKIISHNIHDELNTENNVNNFIEYIAEKFQNKFQRNVSVWQEDFEFKISIPRYYLKDIFPLSKIVETMDYILEDWWSVQWCELENNNIQFKRDSALISFRVHYVHEIQFRYNAEKN